MEFVTLVFSTGQGGEPVRDALVHLLGRIGEEPESMMLSGSFRFHLHSICVRGYTFSQRRGRYLS
jgi:hypothetical protein